MAGPRKQIKPGRRPTTVGAAPAPSGTEGLQTGGLAPFEGKGKRPRKPKRPAKGQNFKPIGQRGQGNFRPTRDTQDVTNDFTQAEGIYNSFFNYGDLPRVENKYAKEQENALSLRGSLANPESASFAGRRSTDVSDILGRMKGGLEGYTAAENANIREGMNRQLEADSQRELKSIQDSNAGNMVLGGAATARSDVARSQANRLRQQNEQDLFIKNIDEKRQRLDAYGNAVTGAESTEFNRGQEAMGAYEKTLGAAQGTDFEIQNANRELEEKDRSARTSGLGGLVDIVNAQRGERKQDKRFEQYFRGQK
jgi:hypothetical protein